MAGYSEKNYRRDYSSRRGNRKNRAGKARARRMAALAGCVQHIFFTAVLILIIFGGFRVQAMASDETAVRTEKVYTSVQIESGDTLWSIAEDYCDEDASNREIASYVDEIRETNHIVNEYDLHEGAWIVVYRTVAA